MKETIDFIKKGLNRNTAIEVYKYFSIKDGEIQVNNGIFALGAPIALQDEIMPSGDVFVRVMSKCKGTIAMSLLPSKKLKVESGNFKGLVPCSTAIYPRVVPEGTEKLYQNWNLAEELKKVLIFTKEDNDVMWANGALFNGQSLMVTNNIVVAEKWLSQVLPHVLNIPVASLKALVTINKPVQRVLSTSNRVTFFFDEGMWLSSSVIIKPWPDVTKIFNDGKARRWFTVADDLKEAVLNLRSKDGITKFEGHTITDGELTYRLKEEYPTCSFASAQLNDVFKVVTSLEINPTTNGSMFIGEDNMRGVIARCRQ